MPRPAGIGESECVARFIRSPDVEGLNQEVEWLVAILISVGGVIMKTYLAI